MSLVARFRSDFARLVEKHLILIKAVMPTERCVKNRVEKMFFDRMVIRKKENYHRVQDVITIRLVLIMTGKCSI